MVCSLFAGRALVHPGRLIALRDALRHYLSRVSGLPALIRAVINSGLAPVAYTNQFRGVTGYIFAWEDLRRYPPSRSKRRIMYHVPLSHVCSCRATMRDLVIGLFINRYEFGRLL